MAPKRPGLLNDPPEASSSEEASSDDEEEEDPLEEDPTLVRKTPTKKPAVKPHSSDSDSDEDEGDAPVAPVKRISSKAMGDSSAAASSKKSRSKPSATPAKRAGGGEEEAASKASKRAKKKSGSAAAAAEEPKKAAAVAGEDEKKLLFQRLWSEEDEIVILKGAINFVAKTGTDPTADMASFLESIKDSIHVQDFTKAQLSDKVRRLRKKFENNVKKCYVPSKIHEKKSYDLSKKIWFRKAKEEPKVNGTPMTAAVRSATVRENGKTPSSSKAAVGTGGDVDSMLLSYFGRYDSNLPVNALKTGLDLVPEDKKAEFLDTWKKIEAAEAELYSRRSLALGEQAKFIVDTFKSG